jgi:hypothetical protein
LRVPKRSFVEESIRYINALVQIGQAGRQRNFGRPNAGGSGMAEEFSGLLKLAYFGIQI